MEIEVKIGEKPEDRRDGLNERSIPLLAGRERAHSVL
jgi:hypothetical protein